MFRRSFLKHIASAIGATCFCPKHNHKGSMITYPDQTFLEYWCSQSSLDNSQGLQNAFDYWANQGGGKIFVSQAGMYKFASPVVVRSHCSLIGLGAMTTYFKYTGTSRALFVTSIDSYNQIRLEDFHIDLSSNTNMVSGIDCERGLMRSLFRCMRVTTNPANLHGIIVRGQWGGNANNGQFNNGFEHCFIKPATNELHLGYGLSFEGANLSNARVNCNRVIGGEYEGGAAAFFINGTGNLFQNVDVELSRGFNFDGDQTVNNSLICNWLDNAQDLGHDPITILSTCTQFPYKSFGNTGLADT